jgi:hypothetical protein
MHFRRIFRRVARAAPQKSGGPPTITALASASGLTLHQRGGAACIDPEQQCASPGHLHDFKTTARIADPQ